MAFILPAWDGWRRRSPAALAAPAGAGRERPGDVGELARPVQLAWPVVSGGPVRERDLDLRHPHAELEQVDGERGLHPEAGRERPGRLERGPGEAALPVERLRRAPPG